MSSPFSNPAGTATASANAYTQALFDLVGDRDPVAVQSELVPALTDLTHGLTIEELSRPEAPGKWSVLQVVDHLADVELAVSFRVRMIVAEDEPKLLGYDQDLWAAKLRYGSADPDVLLAELEALRGRNLRLLRSLTNEEKDRAGLHSERGRESVRHMMRMTAGHDLAHRQQIARIRQGLGKPVVS